MNDNKRKYQSNGYKQFDKVKFKQFNDLTS